MYRLPRIGCLAALLALSACHAGRPAAPPRPKLPSAVVVRDIAEDEFAPAVVGVVASRDASGERSSLLASVVRRQLRRAETLMNLGEREAGIRAVRGALWLVRAGEERPEMWQGAAYALEEAAEEAARVGDEGKARALYSLVKQAAPTVAVSEAVDQHLAAMDRFAKLDAQQRDLEVAGEEQRVAVQRSLYEPSTVHLEAAANKLVAWMRKSLESDVLERWGESSFDREEAIEAFRARRFGAMTMVGVFLRHGAPMNALDWLERNDLGRLLPSDVRERLEMAGEDDEPKAWQALFQHFQHESDPSRADSLGMELAEAAAFGTAVELFRSRPNDLEAVGPLAMILPDLMLGDAVPPLILASPIDELTRERASWSMALLVRAILAHGSVGDIVVARRILAQSQPILDKALQLTKSGEVLRPHPARLHALMASLELRHADLGRARMALERALALEPTASLYFDLARVLRQTEQFDGARQAIAQSIAAARKAADLLTQTEAQVLLYELEADQGNTAPAERALREALGTALSARDRARQPEEQAQAERRFARILELYGEYEGAKRASSRALDASRTNQQQRTATILDSARRAMTHGDLRAARAALNDALDLGISSTDCVYVALWVRILERRLKVPSDGSVEEALSRVGDVATWPSRLKSWALGTMTDAEIRQGARTEVEKTEISFYQAFLSRNAQEAGRHDLLAVAHGPAIGLVEVSVARDLVRLASANPRPRWPEDVSIP